jgi:hypothetical protein
MCQFLKCHTARAPRRALASGYLEVRHLGQQLKGKRCAHLVGCAAIASQVALGEWYAQVSAVSHSPRIGQLFLGCGIEKLHGVV